MLSDREVSLRLAVDREVDRKLRAAASSRFFWVYALSLWDTDAFWRCVSGAAAFAVAGLFMAVLVPSFQLGTQLMATVVFEYFLLGLILMWAYNLGPWLHPTNLAVIFTFIFRLYRKNKTTEDLSAQEIGSMFPDEDSASAGGWRSIPHRLYLGIRRSTALGSLVLGSAFGAMMVSLVLIAARPI